MAANSKAGVFEVLRGLDEEIERARAPTQLRAAVGDLKPGMAVKLGSLSHEAGPRLGWKIRHFIQWKLAPDD